MTKTTFLFLIYLFCFDFIAFSQNDTFCEQVSALKNLIENEHFKPKKVDDSLSNHVFKIFIKDLDARKRLFTRHDITAFEKDRFKIDDYINSTNCEFITKYAQILETDIKNSKLYLNDLIAKPLDYSGKDTLYFDANRDFKYFKDGNAAKKYWSKRVRYNILLEMIEDTTDVDVIKANFKSKEALIKQRVIDKEICLLNEQLSKKGGVTQMVQHTFLNAFLKFHDPHSTFFNASEKDVFEHGLSNNQLSYGITTTKNDIGDIVISYIAPGSPAFKNQNLEVNDVVKSIASNNAILEAYCVSNDAVLEFLNVSSRNEATFKVKKKSGLVKHVKLIKSVVENEENSIKGYIIAQQANSSKVGYINIPRFYTDFESVNGLGMANDVAKEIYKLKRDAIDGLIIDLRFNGGGSIKEAIDLSGMFIDRGPVTIMKYHDATTYTLKDTKRGTVFTAPIVVLVNNFSASASELFAAVMQDYHRAIIVGTTTHGKSSAQVVLPLNESKALGFAKLTVESFYRASGKSHQSIGVVPDIKLPSLYDNFKTEEQYIDYTLPNDEVEVSLTYKPLKTLNLDAIKIRSEKRIKESSAFHLLVDVNKKLVKNYINKKIQYPLTVDHVFQDINAHKILWENFKNSNTTNQSSLIIKNTSATDKVLLYDATKNEINLSVLKDISKDIAIQEAFFILNDIIKPNSNN